MAPRTVNIVLPDGRVVSVPEDVATRLSAGGNARAETDAEAVPRNTETRVQREFGTFTEKAKTLFEGALSGITLGLADPLLNDTASNTRARVNPGTHLAGEAVGIIGGAMASPGSLLGKLPAGLAARGGEAVAARAGGGIVRRLAVQGGVEGAAQGLGGAISHSMLSDDPLTVESALMASGRGALLGFGVGAVAGTVSRVGQRAAEAVGNRASAEVRGVLDAKPELFAGTADVIKTAKKEAQALVDASQKAPPGWSEVSGTLDTIHDGITAAPGRQFAGRDSLAASTSLRKQYNAATKAGDVQGAHAALSARQKALGKAAGEAGYTLQLPEIPAIVGIADDATHAASKLRVPESLDDFASWQPATVSEWINNAKVGAPGALNAMDDLARRVGIAGDTPEALVAGLHNALRQSTSATKSGAKGWFSSLANRTAKEAGGKAGLAIGKDTFEPVKSLLHQAGRMGGGYLLGGPLGVVAEVIGLRAAVTGRIRSMVAKYGESAGKGLSKLAPVTARLGVDMNGNKEEGDVRDLAAKRQEEIYRLASVSRDAAFAVAAPLVPEAGADFAHALGDSLASGTDYLRGFSPKDPGTAFVMGRSDWRQTLDQAEEFASRLEAHDDPWMAIDRQLQGEGDVAGAETLWQMWPAVMNELSMEFLMNAEKLKDLPYDKVISVSQLLRTQLDSLLLPANLTALQSHFIPGNSQLQGGSSTGATGGAPGRPPASTPRTGGTKVQNLTG